MSEAEKTIRLTIDLTYDAQTMHGDDPDDIEWFQELLRGDNLQICGPGATMLGAVKVVDCDPTQDDRVRALEAENARLKHALVVWDAAHRTGRNEPLVIAFETGKSALEVAALNKG